MDIKFSKEQWIVIYIVLFFNIFLANTVEATVKTSTVTGGTYATGTTWVGGIAPATTDSVIIATTGSGVVTVGTSTSAANIVINSGATLSLSSKTLTIANTVTSSGTINATSGGITQTGSANFTNSGTIAFTTGAITQSAVSTGNFINNGKITFTTGKIYQYGTGNLTNTDTIQYTGAGSFYLSGNLTNSGAIILGTAKVYFYGANSAANTVPTLTTTGAVTFQRTAGSVTFTGNISGKTFVINGAGGTLNLGTGLTHTFTSTVTLTAGTLNCNSSILKLNAGVAGTGVTFNAGTGTVNYTGASQACSPQTYYNLILSGSGTKTFATTPTVNDSLVRAGTATIAVTSGTVTYGSTATLVYENTGAVSTTNADWITPFSASGGIILAATATVTMNAAKSTNTGINLTINTGATLAQGANLLTLGGNFINNGTFTGSTGGITITGTATTQTINPFTTTGTVSMTKTAGTATFTGVIGGAGFTLNGSGGTLNLTNGLTYTFSGAWKDSAGTLNCNSSILKIGGSASGNSGTVNPGTGTINYYGTAQTAAAITYNNLTLSGSGAKTLTGVTVNGILSMQGTATASVAPTYGSSAMLQYLTATAKTSGPEWVTPFAATGGVADSGTGVITMGGAKVFNANIPLSISTGATITPGANLLTLGGNFINNGTLTSGIGGIIITNTATSQSIGGFTTTGNVSMTKTAGTATLKGNVNGDSLIINGTGGTLDLGVALSHTYTGAWINTSGTVNGDNSSLNLGGSYTGSGATFIPASGTVNYNSSSNQTIAPLTYNNLMLSGNNVDTFTSAITINQSLSILGTTIAYLGTFISSCNSLTLGGVSQPAGSYGSSSSVATNQNNTYFAPSTGIINSAFTCAPPTINATPTNVTCQGGNNGSISLSVIGGTSPFLYSWTGGSSVQNPSGLSEGIYNVTVTANGGCTVTLTSSVTISHTYATPTANAGGTVTAICQGGTTANLNGTIGGAATGSIWSDEGAGGTFNPNTTTLNATYTSFLSQTSPVTLLLTSTSGVCGTAKDSVSLTLNQTFIPQVNLNDYYNGNICAGTLDTFYASAGASIPAGGTITYSFYDNRTLLQSGSDSTYYTASINDNDTVTCTITVSGVTCLSTTTATDTIFMNVNPLPQGSLTSNSPLCSPGSGAQLTWTGTTGAEPDTIIYNPGPVTNDTVTTGLPGNLFSGTVSSTTTYTIISIKDQNGCIATSGFTQGSTTIVVNSLPNVSNFSVNSATNICTGSSSTVSVTSTTLGNGTYTVTYTLGSPNTATGSTATLVLSGGSGAFSAGPMANAGTTTITVNSVTNANTCSSTISSGNTTSSIVAATGSWYGFTSTDWFTGANWCGGSIPVSTTVVSIPSWGTYMPTITNTGAVCNSITINSGATLATGTTNGLTVSGDWDNEGTFTANSGTITFNNSGTSTISGASTTSFNNLTISSGTLKGPSSGTMNVAGNWINNGTFTNNSSTVNFNGTTTISGSSNTTFNNITISGTLTGSSTSILLKGDWINNGTYNNNNGIVNFNGSSTQNIKGSSATSFNNLTLNRSVSLSGSVNATVTTILAFSGGVVTTNSNKLILGSAGGAITISGTTNSTNYINGNLRYYIPNTSAPTVTFPIGDASNYTPVSITFVGTTSGSGYIDASTSATAPAAGILPAGSGIDPNNFVNRRWILTNTGVTGFTSYSGTFTFVAGDITGSSSTSNFVIREYISPNWNKITTGTRTSTTTQATGLTSFGQSAIGILNDGGSMPLWMLK